MESGTRPKIEMSEDSNSSASISLFLKYMPTERQKRAFKAIAENHGVVSRTMEEVGYSHNTAKKPQNLTESKGWKELMEEHLPDELLATKHHWHLTKRDAIGSKALDMAYKLKGHYAPERHDLEVKEKIPPELLPELLKLADKLTEI